MTAVDRWSCGGSGDSDGIVPTPRGTTQVVTRGILMIRCQVAGTRYLLSSMGREERSRLAEIYARGVEDRLTVEIVGIVPMGPHESFQCQPMNQNYFEPNYSGFDQPPQYFINHQPLSIQENLNQQKMYELLQMMQSFCEKLLQQKQAASIDQSPLQEMSIQDMEDLKQHYLDEILSLSNDLQIKDYRNEKIDIRFRRECESMIDELKGKFNGMSIEINKKKELQHLE
ncbi:hypothetical protein Tco_1282479 [Tanacetum coccineum]